MNRLTELKCDQKRHKLYAIILLVYLNRDYILFLPELYSFRVCIRWTSSGFAQTSILWFSMFYMYICFSFTQMGTTPFALFQEWQ